jgi:hypothetical protein
LSSTCGVISIITSSMEVMTRYPERSVLGAR